MKWELFLTLTGSNCCDLDQYTCLPLGQWTVVMASCIMDTRSSPRYKLRWKSEWDLTGWMETQL